MKTIYISVLAALCMLMTTSLSLAANKGSDADALQGLSSTKAIFDVTTGNPKKLSFYLKLINDTAKSINETIKFSIKLDTNVAQYTILTPYPGTQVYNLVQEKISNKKHGAYDGQHLVFKHNNVSSPRMHWLLLKANFLFYTRSMKSIKDLLHVLRRQRVFPASILKFLKHMFANS